MSDTSGWAMELLTSGRYRRYLKVSEGGEVRLDTEAIRQAPHLDGKWVLITNDDTLSVEDAAVVYKSLLVIEPMFSDFKSRGFGLQETQLQVLERLDRLILVMALAMYWCVRCGRDDAFQAPTPTEKKPASRPTPTIGAFAKPTARVCLGSRGA